MSQLDHLLARQLNAFLNKNRDTPFFQFLIFKDKKPETLLILSKLTFQTFLLRECREKQNT